MNKRLLFLWFAVLAFCANMFSPAPAQAQYNYYMSAPFLFNTYNFPPIKTYPKDYDDDAPKKRIRTKPDQQKTLGNTPDKTSQPGRASSNNNPLPYTRDKALSAQIRETFLRDFAKQMPEAVNEIRAMAEKTDLVQMMAGFAQLEGLDSGTMEGMMALWYGQAWAIANQQPMPSKQQYQGIASQLHTSIQNSSKWSQMGNKQRQEFVEQLAYPLIVQKANYQAYLKQGKRDSIARISAATQEGLKKIGLNLQNLKLDSSGFVGL